MPVLSKRATIYFDPDIHKILKIKAAESSTTISELINRMIKYELQNNRNIFPDEKAADKQQSIYSGRLVEKLKKDGKI